MLFSPSLLLEHQSDLLTDSDTRTEEKLIRKDLIPGMLKNTLLSSRLLIVTLGLLMQSEGWRGAISLQPGRAGVPRNARAPGRVPLP